MASTTDMVLIQMPEQRGKPGPTWKINPRDTTRIQQLVDAGGVVVSGGYETKEATDSHSDQDIGQVDALVEGIDGLTAQQAQAIVAAGYTLATLPASQDELEAIKGIGPATAEKIVEALSE